ncbi:MAG: DNA primase [bacterium]
MKISDETIQVVKQIKDIASFIGSYIQLKKRGQNHIGLCPFHSEKTPSFTVSNNKGFWHCFGCHESGDLISFVMKIDQLTFIEAIKELANKANIPIIEIEENPHLKKEREEKERQKSLLEIYKTHCISNLKTNIRTQEYLKNRGLTKETLEQFSIGLDNTENLTEYLNNKGFNEKEIKESALCIFTEKGNFSRFKDRLIIPITNTQGQTLGFSGRILTKNENQAKYINSAESPLFNKRHLLYGIDKAKQIIKKENHAIIVEGYMDVMMCHQHEIRNCIGIMGTALTSFQCQLLKRYTNEVTLILDNDEAGKKACDKSYELLSEFEIKTYIVKLDKKDPADYLQEKSTEEFKTQINNATLFLDHKISEATQKDLQKNPVELTKTIDTLLYFLDKEKDEILKKEYLKKISLQLKTDETLLLKRHKKEQTIYNHNSKNITLIKSKYEKAIEYLIQQIASNLHAKQTILTHLTIEDFQKIEYINLIKTIIPINETNERLLQSIKDKKQRNILSNILIDTENNSIFHIETALHVIQTKKEKEERKNIIISLKKSERENKETQSQEYFKNLTLRSIANE